jgi:class 3 adenylate cyclase
MPLSPTKSGKKSSKGADNSDTLFKFSRHVPRFLQSQIVCEFANQFLFESGKKSQAISTGRLEDFLKTPSIQRFNGVLLFVDISGFTSLSLKLDVDTLKNHINNYFSKMLSIVEKWGGDVVKFAGDALFIVWPTDLRSVDTRLSSGPGAARQATQKTLRINAGNTSTTVRSNRSAEDAAALEKAMKAALEKAVACGLEICSECSHYEIVLDDPSSHTKAAGLLDMILPNWLHQAPKIGPEAQNVSYLDVHAGVSCGLMAGITIGQKNRSEYFIIGDPIRFAAESEGKASKGELVLCPTTHFLLHRADETKSFPKVILEDPTETSASATTEYSQEMKFKESCTCQRKGDHFYCISHLDVPDRGSPKAAAGGPMKMKKSKSKAKLDIETTSDDVSARTSKLKDDMEDEFDRMLTKARNVIKKKFFQVISANLPEEEQIKKEDYKELDFLLNDICTGALRDYFQRFMSERLLDDIGRHVHEVMRENYHFQRSSNCQVQTISTWIAKPLKRRMNVRKDPFSIEEIRNLYDEVEEEVKPTEGVISPRPTLKPQQSNARLTRALSSKFISDKVTKAAELRTVIVLFMKIEGFDLNLCVDPSRYHGEKKPENMFYEMHHFLDRSENELTLDLTLASKFQECLSVIVDSLASFQGQLRQFIVDDKGTVAIGTFGLRGSVGNDNAAAAVEAAQSIIQGLNEIGLTVSIGITTGKAYCGLVGSANRHEFAVMGPSTNLSARLMAKTPANAITCDFETKSSDRLHNYEALGEITAKGYAQPVEIYRPIIEMTIAVSPFVNMSLSFLVGQRMSFMVRPTSTKYSSNNSPMNNNNSLTIRSSNTVASDSSQNSRAPSHKEPVAPLHEKLTEFVETSFWIPVKNSPGITGKPGDEMMLVDRNSLRPSREVHLHGRKKLIERIISFCFASSPMNLSSSKKANSPIFQLNLPTKLSIFSGSGGTGKSAVLSAMTIKLASYSREEPGLFNVQVIKNHSNQINLNVPFSSCKNVILDLLKTASLEGLTIGRGVHPRRSFHRGSFLYDFSVRLDQVFKSLPEGSYKAEEKKFIYNLLGLTDVKNRDDFEDEDAEEEFDFSTKAELRSVGAILVQLVQILVGKLDKLVMFLL